MPKKKGGFYSKAPSVPKDKVAGSSPIAPPTIGAEPSTPTSTNPAYSNAWSGLPGSFAKAPVVKPHGYRHPADTHKGHLRMSGHPNAHQIGGKPVTKGKKYP